jgi:FdhD protein
MRVHLHTLSENRGGAILKRFLPRMPGDKALRLTRIVRIMAERTVEADDPVAVEEPLEIRIAGQPIAVVMRTPGHDRELAAGFLVTEGLLRSRDHLLDLTYCRPDTAEVADNVINALLAPGAEVDLSRLTRHLFTSSSCGICSRATIDAVRANFPPIAETLTPRREVLAALPEAARAHQAAFAASGGLHASALFSADGRLLALREDVGRHNALDKVVGEAFLADRLPLAGTVLLVSGRVSFEIMQKSLAAGIGCVAAISAPTTAAVDFARASGQTLVGFLRADPERPAQYRFNVYAGSVC